MGLGPFVARDLRAAGAEIPCFLTTHPESAVQAARSLRELAGVDARGYLDLDELIERETPDALAILSPAETHADILQVAARAGLHVLCEKPFVWDVPRLMTRCHQLLAAFRQADRLVWENCQWPYALPAFESLHPGSLEVPPRRFTMELQASSRGLQSLADALPHPLSLLQALSPGDAQIRDAWFSTRRQDAARLSLGFLYELADHSVEVEIQLSDGTAKARKSALCVDGHRADRVVSDPDYRLSLVDSKRSVPLDDPLTRLVGDFVNAIRHTSPATEQSRAREIAQRMQLLTDIVTAYTHEANDKRPDSLQ